MIYTLYFVNDSNTIIETISLDVINSFGEQYSSNVAQNAVETGYIISDSISLGNPKFDIAGVVTDSKFRVKGSLVVFNGNTFVKSQGDNREQVTQISDDEYAEKVKARLIKIWENKEIFGILESKDINNVKGSKVRSIFPCVLSNLSFAKNDASAAVYPNMSIERIRYATVKIGTVTNPVPELQAKWEEQRRLDSQTKGGAVAGTTGLSDYKKEAEDLLKDKAGVTKKGPQQVQVDESTRRATARRMALEEAQNKGNYSNDYVNKRSEEIYKTLNAYN